MAGTQDWKDWLLPGFAGSPPSDQRRARVAAFTLLLLLGTVLGLTASQLVAARFGHAALNMALVLGCMGMLAALRSGRNLTHISATLLVVQLTGLVVSALALEGTANLLTPWIVVPPLFALLQLGPRAGWLSAGFVWVTMGALFAAERSGVYRPPQTTIFRVLDGDRVFAYGLAIMVVLWLPQATQDELAREHARDEADAERQRDLAQQQRLWHLTGGLAHEINNPLAALTMNLEYVRETIHACGKCPVEVAPSLSEATHSANRAAGLIHDLRMVTALKTTPEEPVALHEVAQRAAEEAGRDHGVTVRLDASPVFARATPHVVERAIRELVRNVAWATGQGAVLELRVAEEAGLAVVELRDAAKHREPCEFPLSEFLALHEGGTVRMVNHDTGHTVTLCLPALATTAAPLPTKTPPSR